MAETKSNMVYKGYLEGHADWVTSLCMLEGNPGESMIASASRDKEILIWNISDLQNSRDSRGDQEGERVGHLVHSLVGHGQAVSDLTVSAQGEYILSASWDKTLRLWDTRTASTLLVFKGHTNDVTSCAFSNDCRIIVSGSRDRTIRMWNTHAKCQNTMKDAHGDWVTCVRFSPSTSKTSLLVSAGWDHAVKIWNADVSRESKALRVHSCPVNAVTISPDATLCASGGSDGKVALWKVGQAKKLYNFSTASVNALTFSPCHIWLTVASDQNIITWDLESKKELFNSRQTGGPSCMTSEKNTKKPKEYARCLSVCYSGDGSMLFAGCSDNKIHCYKLAEASTR
jgi:guanine nucleotide-binding protein subunit beta-2-like 1 protein